MIGKSQKSKMLLIEGRSLPLNFILCILSISFAMLFTRSYISEYWTTTSILYLLAFLLSCSVLLILRGFYLYNYFARIGIAVWFLIIGIYQLNDPLGFSTYLQELMTSDAFSSFVQTLPTILGKFLIGFISLFSRFGMFFSIVLVLLGFSLAFKWFYKVSALLTFVIMVFSFGLGLFHLAQDANQPKRTVEHLQSDETTSIRANTTNNSSLSDALIDSLWVDSLPSENTSIENVITVNAALKPCNTTNSDHFFAPLIPSKLASVFFSILLFWSIIILFTQFNIFDNSSQENIMFGLLLWCLASLFGLLTGWYWLISLSALLIYLTLNLKRFGLTIFKNAMAPTFLSALLLFFYGWYNKTFEPLSDMSCYAVGVNLNRISKLKASQAQEYFVYYNTIDGSEHVVGLSDHQIILEASDTHFVFSRILSLPKNTGYTFDPVLDLTAQSSAELSNFHFDDFFENYKVQLFEIQYKNNDSVFYFGLNHLPDRYKKDINVVIQKINDFDLLLNQLHMGQPLLEAEIVFMLAAKDFSAITKAEWTKINGIADLLAKDTISAVALGYSTFESWMEHSESHKGNWLYLKLPENEMQQICRSNASLLVIQKGWITAKYPIRALPKYETIISKLTSK